MPIVGQQTEQERAEDDQRRRDYNDEQRQQELRGEVQKSGCMFILVPTITIGIVTAAVLIKLIA